MAIVVNLDVMMAKRKISLKDLAEKIDITNANLSILKTGKAKAIRFTTLNEICKALDCQPGDILEYVEDKNELKKSSLKHSFLLYYMIFILLLYY
nr:helix-turn-helix transcriptional regulator [Clostridioides difficile]